MTHYWLSIHADYACRHRGACCTSNWMIPVEPQLIPIIGPTVANGVLPMTGDGACAFLDRAATKDRCTVHRDLGVDAVPASCRHFPRVCVIDSRGVSVTLSHYCPTAAAMLFRRDRKLEIVVGPDPVPGGTIEGLDAREALPPLLSPSVLMDHVSYARFERQVVALFADEQATVESALEATAAAVEELLTWSPGGEPLEVMVGKLDSRSTRRTVANPDPALSAQDLARFDEVRGCVPRPHTWDPSPRDAEALWSRRVAKGWPAFAHPVRHYLAAKAFASWVQYQGQGLRTIVQSLRAALSVVRVELLRLVVDRAAGIDEDLLAEAFRRADLLLVHLADRDALARTWSKAEQVRKRSRPRGSW